MRRRSHTRFFREGWNSALKAVARGISLLPCSQGARDDLALNAVDVMVAAMASIPSRLLQTNRELARTYGVSRRTVTNWRREGCPFYESPRKVLDWIARRRYAPKGTEAKFKTRLSDRRIRNLLAETKAGFAEIRLIKELHRIHGIEPDAWLKQFRCPKRPKVRVG